MDIIKEIKKKLNSIKEKFEKHFSVILLIYILLNILYINVGSYFLVNYIVLTMQFSYIYIVFLVINIFLIKYLVVSKKYKKNKIDILLKLIIIFAFISTVLAYNINTSIYGYNGRCEGLFVIAYYMSILFLASFLKNEYKKIVIYSILIGGIIQVIYAIFQKFNLFGVVMLLHRGNNVYGFATHPNFFGTMMILCLSYSMGLFIDAKKTILNVIFAVSSCIFLTGLLLSNTLSAVVGLIIVLVFLLIYSIKNKIIKKFILLCILFAYVLLMLHFLGLTHIVGDLDKTKNETVNIAKGDLDDSYGTGRMYVWKETTKVLPKYIIHGVGVDNFAYILDGKAIKTNTGYFDKAHNEYLQILATMGIFGLISYLCLHFTILKNGIKKAFKTKEVYLILPIIGYIVQAQFNISVIEVAPFFYIGLGFIVDR